MNACMSKRNTEGFIAYYLISRLDTRSLVVHVKKFSQNTLCINNIFALKFYTLIKFI